MDSYLLALKKFILPPGSCGYRLILILLTVLWSGTALPALDHYPTVTGDEVWILSVSSKLAREGILGSDLFAGFFNADSRYFFNLPWHHLEQALLFRLVGIGIWQARLLSVMMALGLVWLVSELAFRWYGGATAVVTALLLVLWRSSLTGIGIPLLAVGRSGRYDLGAVWWIWVAIALLAKWRERPSASTAFCLGVSCGLATLTQFFGVFGLLLVAIMWLGWHKMQILAKHDTYWLLGGLFLVIIPYLLYMGRFWPDAVGQNIMNVNRLSFMDLSFYQQNLLREPLRYARLLIPPGNSPNGYQAVSPWYLVLGIMPVIAYWLHRWRQQRRFIDTIILTSLLLFALGLLLWEQIKAPVYAVVLLPTLCLMYAAAAVAGLEWVWQKEQRRGIRWGGTAVFLLLGVILLAEGLGTYALNWQRAKHNPNSYQAVSERLLAAVPADAQLIGFEQWWWPLRNQPSYLAWINLWQQWRWANLYEQQPVSLQELVAQTKATHLLLSQVEPVYIQKYPAVMQAQFNDLLAHCTVEIAHWDDEEYGMLTVYRLPRTETGQLLCR